MTALANLLAVRITSVPSASPRTRPPQWPVLFAAFFVTLFAHAGGVADHNVAVDAKTFGCILKLTRVRGFYVGNLLGDLKATLAVANSPTGGIYPPGSIVQLIPTEAMVKQAKGSSLATRDWEFFSLDVSKHGSTILKRGFAGVVNSFGGNCLACHMRARADWDMVCETDHGCAALPVTPQMIGALQRTDPRCSGARNVSVADAQALKELEALRKRPN